MSEDSSVLGVGPLRQIVAAVGEDASGDAAKLLRKMVHQMGEISIESYMADFKKVDHLMLPHTLTQSVRSMKQVIKVESIEHNVKIPPDKFEVPSEIKALLGKEDETQADSKTAEK